ncbi:MAG: AAA family ATPase [Candidatus Aminicenantes bacterium]|nr:AAA family ATPase [Candidatus Aminicenantes bacterium]MBL7082746.1 AAA family ATPase [Candidatus Aminicenantes bacterium]
MYEAYWGLKEKPFENTPDPRFIYSSHDHLEAATRLTYAVEERKGAALLTGDYGCGKTVISRLLFEVLPQDKYEIALVTNPLLSPNDLLREICIQMGLKSPPSPPKTQLLSDLNEHLYENMKNQKDTVIIIDEAQAIQDMMTFEELRLLLNFQLNNRFLLTLILIGQPELREMINEFKQLKQRLAIRYHLNPLNKEDTKKYIHHRLKVAGINKNIFSDNVHNLIWENTEGVPRVINTLCDMCLLLGFTKALKEINEDIVKKAIHGLEH